MGQTGPSGNAGVTGPTAPAAKVRRSTVILINQPPAITTQPVSQTIRTGSPVTFSVVAIGSAPLSYQWYKNGGVIAGATAASYMIASVVPGDAASYTCTVSNLSSSTATSSAAVLTVTTAHLGSWVGVTTPAGGGWQAVAAGAGTVVAVGIASPYIMASTDNGATWTAHNPGTTIPLRGIAYYNGVWVAVGIKSQNVYALYSSNLTSWTSVQLTTVGTSGTAAICAGPNQFVIGSTDNTNFVGFWTSTDGASWTNHATTIPLNVSGIAYGNGLYVCCGTGWIGYSSDGASWSTVWPGHLFPSVTYDGIAFGNGVFVAVAEDASTAHVVIVTANGTTFTLANDPTNSGYWQGITFGDGHFLAVGLNGPAKGSMSSTDGLSWGYISTIAGNYRGICFLNDTFVSVNSDGTTNGAEVLPVSWS